MMAHFCKFLRRHIKLSVPNLKKTGTPQRMAQKRCVLSFYSGFCGAFFKATVKFYLEASSTETATVILSLRVRTFKAIQIEVVKLGNPFIILEKLVTTNVASTDIIL